MPEALWQAAGRPRRAAAPGRLPSTSMARGAQKRIASGNASAVTTLTYGFLVSNTVYLLGNYGLWRTPASFTATSIARRRP